MNERSVKSGPWRSTQTTFCENGSGFPPPRGFRTVSCARRKAGSTSALLVMRSPNFSSDVSSLRLPSSSNSQRIEIWQDQSFSEDDKRHSMGQRVHVPASRGTVIYIIGYREEDCETIIDVRHTPEIASTTLDFPVGSIYKSQTMRGERNLPALWLPMTVIRGRSRSP